jgi:serine/threonine-protein kinase
MATPTTSPVSEGEVLAGKYLVEKVLGQGGMGVVVAARHLQLGSTIALKFMLEGFANDPHTVARFMREAQSATRITSEHVARILDVGKLESGAPYMVMEYLDGSDLAKLVETRGPLPVAEAVDYVTQACRALAEAHGKGIVHRDIKPSNLFLTRRFDGSPLVKVLDFGIAKTQATDAHAPGDLTQTQSMMGSPLYASPEQLDSARHANERADIWALGITLHFLLTGRHPFMADSHALLIASIMMGKPAPLREHRAQAPEALERIVLKCLERDPNRRYGSVGELVSALAAIGQQEPRAFAAPRAGETTAALSSPEPVSSSSDLPDESPGRTTVPHSVSDAGPAPVSSRTPYAWMAVAALIAGGVVVAVLGASNSRGHQAAEGPAPALAPVTAEQPPRAVIAPGSAVTSGAAPHATDAVRIEPAVTPAAEPLASSRVPEPNTPKPNRLAAPPVKKAEVKPAPAKPPLTAASPRVTPATSASDAPKAKKPADLDSLIDERR